MVYCDTIQEWGRKKKIGETTFDSPVLDALTLTEKEGVKSIICKLKYLTRKHPSVATLGTYFIEKEFKFKAINYNFEVHYSFDMGGEDEIFRF